MGLQVTSSPLAQGNNIEFQIGKYFHSGNKPAMTAENVADQLNDINGLRLGSLGAIKMEASVERTSGEPVLKVKIGDEVKPRQANPFDVKGNLCLNHPRRNFLHGRRPFPADMGR